jgi:hypothetical protein
VFRLGFVDFFSTVFTELTEDGKIINEKFREHLVIVARCDKVLYRMIRSEFGRNMAVTQEGQWTTS